MFEIVEEFMKDFINLLPGFLVIYLIFDFIGSLLFGKQ